MVRYVPSDKNQPPKYDETLPSNDDGLQMNIINNNTGTFIDTDGGLVFANPMNGKKTQLWNMYLYGDGYIFESAAFKGNFIIECDASAQLRLDVNLEKCVWHTTYNFQSEAFMISKEFEKIMNIAWDIENGSEDQKAPIKSNQEEDSNPDQYWVYDTE